MMGNGFRMVGKGYHYAFSGAPNETWPQGMIDAYAFGFLLKVCEN